MPKVAVATWASKRKDGSQEWREIAVLYGIDDARSEPLQKFVHSFTIFLKTRFSAPGV